MDRVRQLLQYVTKSTFVRSIFFQIISVFLIIIILLVAIVSYSFSSEIRNGVLSDQKQRLDVVEETISSRMEEVTSIAYNIGQDPTFFLNPVSGIKYSGYEMSNTLARYLVGNRFIEYLAYYRLSEPERIYTSCGELSYHRFWDAYLNCEEYTEETYLELIKSNTGVRLIPISSVGRGVTYFTYVCPLPQFSTDPQAFVIALIPYDEVASLLSSQLVNSDGEIVLFDAGGNEICRVSTLEEDITLSPPEDGEAAYTHVGGSRYVTQARVSEVNSWSYVSAIRLSSVLLGLESTQLIVIAAVVILMVATVCILLTGIISKYKPISNLAQTLTDPATQEGDGIIDEKSLLSSTIATLKSDSEQKQKLEVAYHEANEASKAKSTFLSNMSHDIRTPMNAVIGMTGLALKHMDDPAYVRECLQKVQVASHYLLDIINNVLDMSRIESGKITLTEDVIDLPAFVQGIITIIHTNIEEKRQQLRVEVDRVRNEKVMGDAVRLTQVCMNILSNAIKYTPEGGSIGMRISQQAAEDGFGAYTFVFTDTGIGMSPDFVEKVFDTFSRAEESGVSGVEGTGLGMAIAKSLVELMGGSITCQSVQGEGSTFTVSLRMRLADDGLAQARQDVPEDVTIDMTGKRALLVEDNKMNREIARRLISEIGVEVTEAVNGKEAVEAFSSHAEGYFDVILMDVQMPVMDGLAAAAAIRAMRRADAVKIPIYAMTANTFDEDVREAARAGMDGHLGKPYAPEELYRVLQSAAALKR